MKKRIEIGFKAFAVIIAIASLALSATTAYRTRIWNQKFHSLQLIKEWNQSVSNGTKAIKEKFNDNIINEYPIDPEIARSIVNADNGEYFELNEELKLLFNQFEYISIAYSTKIVDQDLIEISCEDPMLLYYVVFQPYLQQIKASYGDTTWNPYTQLVHEWDPSLKKRVITVATGQRQDHEQ